MDLSELKRDSRGKWIDNLPGADPKWRFRVRGFRAPHVIAWMQWRARRFSAADRDADRHLLPQAEDAAIIEATHQVVLMDWDGLELDGKPLPYSAETAKKLLTDPDFRLFADLIATAAARADIEAGAGTATEEK